MVKAVTFVVIVFGLVVAAVAGAGCGFTFGYMEGYDKGFEVGQMGRLPAVISPIDWTTPENQEAIRKAFPPAVHSPTDEPR